VQRHQLLESLGVARGDARHQRAIAPVAGCARQLLARLYPYIQHVCFPTAESLTSIHRIPFEGFYGARR
jgi:hypothetical protein